MTWLEAKARAQAARERADMYQKQAKEYLMASHALAMATQEAIDLAQVLEDYAKREEGKE